MRLTGLRLSGFKSFADPTELGVEPGLTGVVGPNGCGKSNLLEGLRWAMGETRPSSLRGQGMEDVIFAGTARRPARARAEVALLLDREGEEVEVVRRVNRDGGSAYRVGGREARARDVQAMFADAASGAQSPALVRQGQIAELIAAKPFARRRVIEDAAGVAGLQVRRAEAAQRLSAAEENLRRLGEVTRGLADRLRSLDRQARNARAFREASAALRDAEGRLLWRGWQAAEEAAAGAGGEARTRGAQAARAGEEAARAAEAREGAEAGLPGLRRAAGEAGERRAVLRAEGEALAGEGRAAAERLRAAREALGALARDEAREAALGRDADGQLRALGEEAARLAAAGEGEAEAADERRAASEAAARRLAEAEAEVGRLTDAAAVLAAEHAAAGRRVAEAREARDRAGAEAARGAAALAAAEGARARAEALGAQAREAQGRAAEALAAAEAGLAAAEAALAPLRAADAEARARLARAEAEAAGLGAEARALSRLVEADGRRGALPLGVPEGWEAAVAAALGPDLRAPLAEGGGAPGEVEPGPASRGASQSVAGVAQGDAVARAAPSAGGAGLDSGWVALPPLAEPLPAPPNAVPLADRVEAPPALARRFRLTFLVPDGGPEALAALHATLLPGQAAVTPAGDLLRWDGLRVLAADAVEAQAEAEALRRAARLPRLRAEAGKAEGRARDARAAQGAAEAALGQGARTLEAARGARGAAERQAAEAQRLLGRADADGALADARAEAARAARDGQAGAVAAALAALSEAEAALAALPDPRAARTEAERAGRAAAEARSALLAARGAEDEGRRRAEGRALRLAEVGREEASWRARAEAGAARAADLAARRAEAAAGLADAEGRVPAVAARAEGLALRLREAEARLAEAGAALSGAEGAARAAGDAEREAGRAASAAREAFVRAEERRLGAEEALAQAVRRIREARGLSPRELLDSLGPGPMPPEAALVAEAAALRRRRDAIGPVNLRAEEDARALRDEQGTLLREAADLDGAIAALRQALQALSREGRERMVAAFGRVDAEFGRLFRHLFGGGEARLRFVEGDDPLEAGVEILAQPPGKALSTLTLLSGGEQTLTALALIFAVFLSAPAPVCVLDEVDAPLDDANVGRFCDLLAEMARSTETRFLVITHHAVTMARMDRLYGVTMAEPGVSQLVSVDLRAAEALVA